VIGASCGEHRLEWATKVDDDSVAVAPSAAIGATEEVLQQELVSGGADDDIAHLIPEGKVTILGEAQRNRPFGAGSSTWPRTSTQSLPFGDFQHAARFAAGVGTVIGVKQGVQAISQPIQIVGEISNTGAPEGQHRLVSLNFGPGA
jgi:hypothetical protein